MGDPIPKLRIDAWMPGSGPYELVNLSEVGEGWSRSFVSQIPLHRARLIKECFDACREIHCTLNVLANRKRD